MPNEFVIKNGYLSQGNSQITGSLTVTAGITGSLQGTASFAASASYAPAILYERKSDFQDPYLYCGLAISGSDESSNVWNITRVEIFISGSVDEALATGAWTNRYSLIYT